MARIRSYRDLDVYKESMQAAMLVFEITRRFPPEEKYSMVDQMRRSSRSVCTNLAEAWRKRRYAAHFISKLSDCETEAEETRVWIEIAYRCKYMERDEAKEMYSRYHKILGKLVRMSRAPEKWTAGKGFRTGRKDGRVGD